MNSNIAKQLVDSLHDSLTTAVENLVDSIKTEANLLAETRARKINEVEGHNVRLRTEADKLRMEISRLADAVKNGEEQIAKEQEKVRELEAQLRTIRPGRADRQLDLLLELEARVEGYLLDDEDSYDRLREQLKKIKEWRNGS